MTLAATVASLLYNIWMLRNICFWDNEKLETVNLVKELKLGIIAEAGCLSKTLIDQGFAVSELGGMDGFMRKLRESEDWMESLHSEGLVEKALRKRDQVKLKITDDVIASNQKDFLNAQEEIQGLSAKLKTLEELHKIDLETTASIASRTKFLCAGNQTNFELRLHFMLDPEATVVRFWEKNKKLEQAFAVQVGPRLPPSVD
uniref:Uncharacterized protein n=1 Tax=Cannabis sativa TaxID=3483 RepID=A0A803Q7J2_CANSA